MLNLKVPNWVKFNKKNQIDFIDLILKFLKTPMAVNRIGYETRDCCLLLVEPYLFNLEVQSRVHCEVYGNRFYLKSVICQHLNSSFFQTDKNSSVTLYFVNYDKRTFLFFSICWSIGRKLLFQFWQMIGSY